MAWSRSRESGGSSVNRSRSVASDSGSRGSEAARSASASTSGGQSVRISKRLLRSASSVLILAVWAARTLRCRRGMDAA